MIGLRRETWGIPAFNGQEITRSPVREMKEESEKSVKKIISKGICVQGVKWS